MMTRLLTTDHRVFEARFPEAAAFLTAATLRYECYSLMQGMLSVWISAPSSRQEWVLARVRELLQAPACREPWFIEILRCDGFDLDEATAAKPLERREEDRHAPTKG